MQKSNSDQSNGEQSRKASLTVVLRDLRHHVTRLVKISMPPAAVIRGVSEADRLEFARAIVAYLLWWTKPGGRPTAITNSQLFVRVLELQALHRAA